MKPTKAKVEKAKQIEMFQKKPTASAPDQSLHEFTKSSSSSYITFDENYRILEMLDQNNDVTSVVNDENIVILESNPSSLDLYKKDVSVHSSNVDFWLELYMAADNLNT